MTRCLRRFAFILLASAWLSACGGSDSGSATTPTPIPTTDFTAVQAAIDASPVSELYVVIGTRSGAIYSYRTGGFSPTAITPIASATKMLSGVTILRLVEAGRMSPSDHPQKYLSYWPT